MAANGSETREDRIPVIVGVGEIVDRPTEIAAGLEPLALLEEALKRAEADAGARLLGEIQSLDVISFLSWAFSGRSWGSSSTGGSGLVATVTRSPGSSA